MNYLDLFHGIGGFALGAYWAGIKFEHHYCSDIEPWCQELYAKRFPDSVQLGDITKIDTSKLPAGEWIITGGFPCQDISIAGKGAGIHGERSGLWFEYWRIINDLRPRFAIMENVGMLVHRGLREVLGSLAEIGYDAEWQDIRASDVGAPHRRERIWIVAYAASDRQQRPGSFSSTQEGLQPRPKHSRELESRPEGRGEISNTSRERCGEKGTDCERSEEWTSGGGDVADASIPRLQGQNPARCRPGESGLFAECGNELSDAERRSGRSGIVRGEREPGYVIRHGRCGDDNRTRTKINAGKEWWSTEPAICGMADGLSAEFHGYEGRIAVKSHQRVDRLRGLGNAIVPQIAELLFRQIFAKTY